MWEARQEIVPSGTRHQIFDEGSRLSFRELFTLLEQKPDFALWYSNVLASAAHAAFFWELPPLTDETFDNDAEFVLIESSSLASVHPDPEPFASQFASHSQTDVITFVNLGGDAVLVAPRPIESIGVYPHLATFVRGAPDSQVVALWKATAQVVREHLGPSPRWLSTSGLGVSWLHLRLDTRPKYYQFAPYKVAA